MTEFRLPDSPIIDCRDRASFKQRHLKGSVNIPAAELFQRMHELPQKQQTLTIVYDRSSRPDAKTFFTDRHFIIERWIADEDFNAIDPSLLSKGRSSIYHWQPAPFVKQFEQYYLKPNYTKKNNNNNNNNNDNLNNGVILDLACGAGRDAVYLSMQGWQVIGVDYSETALQRCQLTASEYDQHVELKQADLEKDFDFASLHINHPVIAVVVCRYLHRPLMSKIKSLLAPGGMVAYHTFMQGCEKIGSPRNPNYLLKPNELAETFDEFIVLQNEVSHLSDGRPVANFVARKPL